jgi:ABC-type nitrate/sulfonate/bicarbonate transport system substrate-binding protein
LELAYQIGAHVVVDIGAHPDPLVRVNTCTPRTFTVSGALLDRHPELVQRLVKRVVAAGEWAISHPAEAVRHIGLETATADNWVKYGYGRDVHQHLRTDLSEHSVAALSNLAAFLYQWDFLPEPVDVRRWIDGPLQAGQVGSLRTGATV